MIGYSLPQTSLTFLMTTDTDANVTVINLRYSTIWALYLWLVTQPSPHPHAECGGVWRQALIMTDGSWMARGGDGETLHQRSARHRPCQQSVKRNMDQ